MPATIHAPAAAPADAELFSRAATRVARRLAWVDGARLLGRSAVPVFAVATILWAMLRRTGVRDHWSWAAGLVLAWLVVVDVLAWSRRRRPFEALAAWDRQAGRREMFASAWSFAHGGVGDVGTALHLARARAALAAADGSLRRAFPLRLRVGAWLAPLAFAIFAGSGWLRVPVAVENRALSAEARALSTRVGSELAKLAGGLEPLKGLSDEERKRLQHLQSELADAAKKLDRMETPRDLLEELERRARDAEKLAEELRTDEAGTLSSPLLAELESNADTAELGNALRAQDLGRVAEEARLLQARLGHQKPTLEEQQRLEEALKRAADAMNDKDRKTKAGERLNEARKQLAAGERQRAAEQFGELADRFGRAAQRQHAQQQLRELAQNFRGAGGQILGGQNLQRLDPAPPGTELLPGLPQFAPGQNAPGLNPPGDGAPLALSLLPGDPPPGAPRLLFPVPGTGQPGAPALAMPGGGDGGDPDGIFPIPGAGGGLIAGAGELPVETAGAGGSAAGRGTAPLGADPTKPLAAHQTGVVAPTPGAEGPSEMRSVAGQSHREQAVRERTEIAREFLKGEEAALADEPLPLSRRTQVLLYFTALRQQLEHQP